MSETQLYQIALTKIKGVGPIQSKQLLSKFSDPKDIFDANYKEFLELEGFGLARAKQFQSSKNEAVRIAEQELKNLEKSPQIKTLFITDKDYPNRLKYCADAPILLFTEGNMNLNQRHVLSIVGTRKQTDYGRGIVKDFLFELKEWDILIVSGLAYGTDTFVHKTCVDYTISTVGVLAHGLDRLYPSSNKSLAIKMKQDGGLLTEYSFNTNPNRENFPTRNRIVAALADATIIVESGERGGSLITAQLANSYNREVFAFPGDIQRKASAGCNQLIKKRNATLINNFEDVCLELGWNHSEQKIMNRQRQLFVELDETEQRIVQALNGEALTAMQISIKSGIAIGLIHSILLTLELKGVVKISPGNRYSIF